MITPKQLKDKLTQHNISGLALDIDDTLSGTRLYIMERMSELFGNPEQLSPQELLNRYKRPDDVPFWQGRKALDWLYNFADHNDEVHKFDLVENMHHQIQNINAIIPIVAYITARSDSMETRTIEWLTTHNFPPLPLLMRPSEISDAIGSAWKASVLEHLYPQVVGIVDDNPSLIDNLTEKYKGTVFLYTHTEHNATHIEVIPCKSWTDVYHQVKKKYS